MNSNLIINTDCMKYMASVDDNSFDFTITDIPYATVSRRGNGLRELDKKHADKKTFDLDIFLPEVFRITKGSIVIFCGNEQYSKMYDFFNDKSMQKLGTTRQLVWAKTNPSPMNGEYVYLSATENAVWFRKSGAPFNAFCKRNVFNCPSGRKKYSPTEKPAALFSEIIIDNTNPGAVVYDPCCGGGTTAVCCISTGRNYICNEMDSEQYNIAVARISSLSSQ